MEKKVSELSQEELGGLLCQKYDLIERFFMQYPLSKPDQEDLVQETFGLAYKSIHALRDINKIDAWVRKIAENNYKQFLKKQTRQTRLIALFGMEQLPTQALSQGRLCGG